MKVPYIIIGLAIIGGGVTAFNFLGHGGQIASLARGADVGAPSIAASSTSSSDGPSDDSIIKMFMENVSKDPSNGDDESKQCFERAGSGEPRPGATFSSDEEYHAVLAEAHKHEARCADELAARTLGAAQKYYDYSVVGKKSEGYFSLLSDIRMTDKRTNIQTFWRTTLQNDGKQWAMTDYSQLTK